MEIVLIVIGIVLAVLFVGGTIANGRRTESLDERLHERVRAANEALAEAHAQDRGWEPANVEAAARAAYEQRNPGAAIEELHLIQVIDRPGTDEDQAIWRVVAGGRSTELTLGRRGGEWVAE